MSDSSGSGMGAVKMLESAEQYEDWAQMAEGYLTMVNAFSVCDGSEARPASGSADLKDWLEKENRAKGFFIMKVSRSIRDSVFATKTSAKDIWTALETTFKKKDKAYQFSLFDALINEPRFVEDKSLTDQINQWLARLERVVDKATTSGTTTTTVTLNEQVKVYWLLSKLPLSYRPHISTIITTTADTDMMLQHS